MSELGPEQVSADIPAGARMRDWDANKATFEREQFEDAVYAEAGKTDFSDEAKQRVEEGATYEVKMEQFAGDDSEADLRYQEGVDSGEIKDGVDRSIADSAELRRMDMMAQHIAELRAGEQTEQTQRMIKDKEEKLQELLLQYRDSVLEAESSDMESVKREAIVDRIIEHTSNINSSQSVEQESTEQTSESSTNEVGAETDGEESGVEGQTEEANAETEVEGDGQAEEEVEEVPETPEQRKERENAMFKLLDDRRREYATLTGRDRSRIFGRFFSEDNWFNRTLKRIPGVEKAIGGFNHQGWSEELSMAAAAYEDSLRECIKAFEKDPQESPEEVKRMEIEFLLDSDRALEAEIAASQKEFGSPADRFSNWWVRQEGFTGQLKKAGAVLAIGALAGGVTAGIFGAAFGAAGVATVGSIAGGLASAGAAKHVTDRRANSIVEDGMTYADIASQESLQRKEAAITEAFEGEEGSATRAAQELVTETENITEEEVVGNRDRVRQSASLGAAAGGIAGGITGNVTGEIFHPNTPDQVTTAPEVTQPNPDTVSNSTTPTPEVVSGTEQVAEQAGRVYEFGYGAAPENLLRQVAPDQLGQQLNGNQAYKLINRLYESLGDRVFDGLDLTLHSPGNVWIQNPGGSTSGLTPEAVDLARQLIQSGSI